MKSEKTHQSTETTELFIEKLVYGGHGLAHHNGKAIMVNNAIDGETVNAKLTGKKKGIHWALLESIITENKDKRITPICKHAKECGGCTYQHIKYSEQIKTKEQILQELYPNQDLGESIYSDSPLHYRNKCEFTFGTNDSGELILGMHMPGRYFDILDLTECYLLSPSTWSILQKALELAKTSKLPAYNDYSKEGFWETITIREAANKDGDVNNIVCLKVHDERNKQFLEIAKELTNTFPNIKGIFSEGPGRNAEMNHIWGINSLLQSINDLEFIYQVENFFQINQVVLPQVLDRITELAASTRPKAILDLFSGVGVLGIYTGKKLNCKVIVSEVDKTASKLANFNAELNDVTEFESYNWNLFQGGWGKTFNKLINADETCLIIDPPRAGVSKKTIKQILEINPANIIYMSCNPTTQKRDIELLSEQYTLESMQLIDMFPQTYHLESLGLLRRKESN